MKESLGALLQARFWGLGRGGRTGIELGRTMGQSFATPKDGRELLPATSSGERTRGHLPGAPGRKEAPQGLEGWDARG